MASHVVRHVLHQAIDHGGAPHRRRTEGEGRRGPGRRHSGKMRGLPSKSVWRPERRLAGQGGLQDGRVLTK